MTAVPVTIADQPPADAPGRSVAWWGTVAMIGTEAMLFALLLFSYLFLRAKADSWPPQGIAEPELLRSGMRSLLLFASSATIHLADRAARRDDHPRVRGGLLATLVLASVFFAGHVHEMATLPQEYTWSTHAYGSLWYVITNFHALHLAVGMIMIAFVLVASLRGVVRADRHEALGITSMYWHFVDVVWLFVYSTLYLLPHLT